MPPVAHEADKIRRPDAQLQRKQPHSGGGEWPGWGGVGWVTGLFHAESVMS